MGLQTCQTGEIKLENCLRWGSEQDQPESNDANPMPGDRGLYVISREIDCDARLLENICIQTVIRTSARRSNTSPVLTEFTFIASNVEKDELEIAK